MKKILSSILIASFLVFALPTNNDANAAYNPDGDIYVEINLSLLDWLKLSDVTGRLTFEAQENIHQWLRETYGIDIEYSYIWIVVNGYKVLAIDPPKPMFGTE